MGVYNDIWLTPKIHLFLQGKSAIFSKKKKIDSNGWTQ